MPDQADVIVAIVTSAISLVTAAVTAILTRKNDTRLKHLENKLAIERAEQDARRDYEYEARKRLYQECEPILFQFAELSESALRRIHALARNAKEGNLGPDRYWLSTDHYFIKSTIYRLIAPMAAFRLLQRRLTSIDLKLDQTINLQYILGKTLYYSFSSSPDLAKSEPPIPYDPDYIGLESKDLTESEKEEYRTKYPEKFWLQGIKVGMIDILAETLISATDKEKDPRIKSFGEFEQEFFEKSHPTLADNRFEIMFTLFSYFHPMTRPVLWRVLLSQAYLYNAIRNIRNNEGRDITTDFDRFKKLFEIEETKLKCDWRQPHERIDSAKSNEDFEMHFKGAESYLRNNLQTSLFKLRA
jgi:hypothetical protein